MLSRLHDRAYQDFITLLTDFRDFVDQGEIASVKQEFDSLQQWFDQNIATLDQQGIKKAYIPRWESVHREINREFKLLTTDILFLASARQHNTKMKRLKSINERLTKSINYCQGIIKEASNQE